MDAPSPKTISVILFFPPQRHHSIFTFALLCDYFLHRPFLSLIYIILFPLGFTVSPLVFTFLCSCARSFIQYTLVPSLCLKWNTTHKKKIYSPFTRTFRPPWIIHSHISAPHLLTPREVLFFPTQSNEIWMAFFFLPHSHQNDCLTEVGLMERSWSEASGSFHVAGELDIMMTSYGEKRYGNGGREEKRSVLQYGPNKVQDFTASRKSERCTLLLSRSHFISGTAAHFYLFSIQPSFFFFFLLSAFSQTLDSPPFASYISAEAPFLFMRVCDFC